MKIYRAPSKHSVKDGKKIKSYPVYVSELQEKLMAAIMARAENDSWRGGDLFWGRDISRLRQRGWIKNIGTRSKPRWISTGVYNPEYLSERID